MKLTILNSKFEETNKTLEVQDSVLNIPYNEALIHQVVTSTLTNARSGTKAQKTRADVSGGGAKPWRQKGSGRARAGTTRSPLWRTGGVTFAARPKNYDLKINKKMYVGALRSILSELNRLNRLVVVDSIDLKEPKTKELAVILKSYLDQKIMLITKDFDMNLFLSSRNLKNVYMIDVELLDPVSLVDSERVIITAEALKSLEEALS